MNIREHILNAAEALFNERGYTAVGIDLIRDTAKVSKTTMYRQFRSKQGLIHAVMERRDQRFRDSLRATVEQAPAGTAQVRAIFEWHFQWFQSKSFKGCMFMHALAEFKSSDADISELAREHKRWIKRLLFEQVPGSDAERAKGSELLMTLLEGLIIQAEFDSGLPSYDYMEHVIEGVLRI